MKTFRLYLSIAVLLLMVMGCANTAQPTATQPEAEQVPPSATIELPAAEPGTIATQPAPTAGAPAGEGPQGDTVVLPANCYREGLPTYVDRKNKICFAYPQHFAPGDMNQGQPAIYGPALDKSADPLRATLAIEIRPAAGRQLPDLLSTYAVETGTPVETLLSAITLDGEAGKVLDPIHGRPNVRAILVLHNSNLYVLSFAPSLKDTPASEQSTVWKQGQKDMEALYEIVTGSFGFLDQPRIASLDSTIGVPAACLVDGNALYIGDTGKFCLAVPPGFVVDEFNPGERGIFGPARDTSADPLRASLNVHVKPASMNLGDSISAFLHETGTTPETRLIDVTIGGQAGKMLDPVNGRPNSRSIVVLTKTNLYILSFAPSLKGAPASEQTDTWKKGEQDMEQLYQLATASFSFMPTSSAETPEATGWESARQMILDGQVNKITQAHSLQVTLTLTDGRVVNTVEPEIDAVLAVVKQCGDKCSGIAIATE